MATLLDNVKLEIQREVEGLANDSDIPIRWNKGALSAAAQAVEDELSKIEATTSAAIDTATLPFGVTFTNAEKKWIGRIVMRRKYISDVVEVR